MANLEDLLFKYLRNSSNERSMIVAGSSGTPILFKYVLERPAKIERINFTLLDGGMRNDYFGGLAALTNGLTIKGYDVGGGDALIDFLDGETIKSNAGFVALAGTDSIVSATVGADLLPVRWTLSKGAGEPIDMQKGQYIEVAIRDPLVGLDRFDAMLQGKFL